LSDYAGNHTAIWHNTLNRPANIAIADSEKSAPEAQTRLLIGKAIRALRDAFNLRRAVHVRRQHGKQIPLAGSQISLLMSVTP